MEKLARRGFIYRFYAKKAKDKGVRQYHCRMFNFGKPKTAGDWMVHIAGAIIAILLIGWMLRTYVM